LVFAGWRRVDDLEDRTITVWSKEDVPPATPVNAPQVPPHWQGLLWGILPISSSILAMLLALIPEKQWTKRLAVEPSSTHDNLVLGRMIS
jgi:hypothetical protein